MVIIINLKCSSCGARHGTRDAQWLVARRWLAVGVSKTGVAAQAVTCPECLERLFGREFKPGEFQVPKSG